MSLASKNKRICACVSVDVVNISESIHLVSVNVENISDFSGDIGGVYPSTIKAVLPRLLSAAAPLGNAAKENRRQCLKASK